MFGMNEIIVLGLAVIILLFGAKKIPEFARSLGRAKGEFERGKLQLDKEIRDSDLKETDTSSSVQKAAKELNIDTTGKTDEQLKKEISTKMNAS